MKERQSLAAHIQSQLEERENVRVVVGEAGGAIILSGVVTSEADRRRIEAAALALAQGRRIENNLEVERFVQQEGFEEGWAEGAAEAVPEEAEESPDVLPLSEEFDTYLRGEPLETNEINVVDDSVYDADPGAEPEPAYFAPTDPVIDSDARGNVEVLGGFTPTSMSSEDVEPSVEDTTAGDEALADAVRRELREDASTTDLRVDVEVEEGVVYLRGRVAGLEDVENAEAVASTVPGVREVIEEFEVGAM